MPTERINSAGASDCKCKKKKKRILEDQFKTEICDGCLTVLSYERPVKGQKSEKKPGEKKKPAAKKLTAKQVKAPVFEPIRVIEFKELDNIKPNTAYLEKCEETMARMPNGFVDMVITSPPYNVGDGEFAKYEDYKDNLSEQQYLEWQIKIISELLRITRTHVFYNTQMLTNNKIAIIELMSHFKEYFKELIIWNKKSVTPASAKGVMSSKFELIMVFSHDNPHLRAFADGKFHGTFTNVLEVHREKNENSDIHKATFPINLPRTILKNFGRKGDLIYDPFGGMFTTAKAAVMEQRRWIVSEMSPQYYKQGMKNIKAVQATGMINFDPEEGIAIDVMEDAKPGKKIKQIKLEM